MKYFVVSDIHSFYKSLMNGLEKAGFDLTNPSHKLIVLGDIFDRGKESIKVYKFLSSLPSDRLILVLGNHELLIKEVIVRGYFDLHDYLNGTVRTFKEIARYYYKDKYCESEETIISLFIKSPVWHWLERTDIWHYYYEISNYLFIHSTIPVNYDWRAKGQLWNPKDQKTYLAWYEAMWDCPYTFYLRNGFKHEVDNHKIIVCGHWSVDDWRQNVPELEIQPSKDKYSTFIGKNIICLDGCVAVSKKTNVFTFEDD